jgi:hypothetical protein
MTTNERPPPVAVPCMKCNNPVMLDHVYVGAEWSAEYFLPNLFTGRLVGPFTHILFCVGCYPQCAHCRDKQADGFDGEIDEYLCLDCEEEAHYYRQRPDSDSDVDSNVETQEEYASRVCNDESDTDVE